MKWLLPFIFFTLFSLSGCSGITPKPTIKTILKIKETSSEEYTPSGNLIKKETFREDNSQTIPEYYEPPKPTMWERFKSFVIKYSIIFGIILFLFPSVGMMIFGFLLRRSRTVLTQVVKGVKDFTDKDDIGNKDLFNHLSRNMDRKSKDIVKKYK